MGKKETHIHDLNGLLPTFLETGSSSELVAYLRANSNLPGRRGNIELAAAFGDVLEAHLDGNEARLWNLCIELTAISVSEAPVNTAEEFLPFCGAVGVGALGSLAPEHYQDAVDELKRLAADTRWRMREAVCFGLQRLLGRRPQDTLDALSAWVGDGEPLVLRAAAAAVAEPALLRDEESAKAALQLHKDIFSRFTGLQDRKCEEFKTLRKGLGYTLSVVVCAAPEQGFAFMHELAQMQDNDIHWILKQNLKKNRLIRNYPQNVEDLQL